MSTWLIRRYQLDIDEDYSYYDEDSSDYIDKPFFYKVGYFQPDGHFYEYVDSLDKIEAEEMCSYLNGGSSPR